MSRAIAGGPRHLNPSVRALRCGRGAFAAITLSLAVLFGSAAGAQTPRSEAPASFTLPNGMRVVVIPDHRTPVVTQMIWYKVGSADETPGKSGSRIFSNI